VPRDNLADATRDEIIYGRLEIGQRLRAVFCDGFLPALRDGTLLARGAKIWLFRFLLFSLVTHTNRDWSGRLKLRSTSRVELR